MFSFFFCNLDTPMDVIKRDHKSHSFAIPTHSKRLKTSLCNVSVDIKLSLLLIRLPTHRHNTSPKAKFSYKVCRCTKRQASQSSVMFMFPVALCKQVFQKLERLIVHEYKPITALKKQQFLVRWSPRISKLPANVCNHKPQIKASTAQACKSPTQWLSNLEVMHLGHEAIQLLVSFVLQVVTCVALLCDSGAHC